MNFFALFFAALLMFSCSPKKEPDNAATRKAKQLKSSVDRSQEAVNQSDQQLEDRMSQYKDLGNQ